MIANFGQAAKQAYMYFTPLTELMPPLGINSKLELASNMHTRMDAKE